MAHNGSKKSFRKFFYYFLLEVNQNETLRLVMSAFGWCSGIARLKIVHNNIN